jgi:hypothetical protein
MGRKKILTFSEVESEKFKILQEIINCDNWIYRTIGNPEAQQVWVQRKNDFEFTLSQLETDNEINLI